MPYKKLLRASLRFRLHEHLSRCFVSSKQVVENPGSGCCKAPSMTCKAPEEEKTIAKKTDEFECCPNPPIKYDEQFKDQLQHKEREYQRTWIECPPRTIVRMSCEECTDDCNENEANFKAKK